MMQRIGACSICGGDVMAWTGPYHSVVPPGPARCSQCGAVEAASGTVIPMVPSRPPNVRDFQTFDNIPPSDAHRGAL